MSEIDADVEILIGTNVPCALKPLVIRSMAGGPYAVEVVLDWTVNGPLAGYSDSSGCQSAVTVNRISAITLDELWNNSLRQASPRTTTMNCWGSQGRLQVPGNC